MDDGGDRQLARCRGAATCHGTATRGSGTLQGPTSWVRRAHHAAIPSECTWEVDQSIHGTPSVGPIQDTDSFNVAGSACARAAAWEEDGATVLGASPLAFFQGNTIWTSDIRDDFAIWKDGTTKVKWRIMEVKTYS